MQSSNPIFLDAQDLILALSEVSISSQKAIAVSDLITTISDLLTSKQLELLSTTGIDCEIKQLGKESQKGKIKINIQFIPEPRVAEISNFLQIPKAKKDKVAGWAETVRLASRTYDSGKRDLAFKFLKTVSAQIQSDEDRKRLDDLVGSEIRDKKIWVHYHSLVFQGGSTAIKL
ncbi:KGK domain protein [Synechococcus sp. PCC 7502]|uniref:KGK domain-containing protein n=1 Tax=Synechococcus sp. PCC 7502 TaxID=1173263 RepID=UPI00029FBC77|nr:KGK domain-containing protein [Synechococcus sp. PCC 7502]AFY74319.1 KGK domain protein [Synechococcus sp. PCC 7502]